MTRFTRPLLLSLVFLAPAAVRAEPPAAVEQREFTVTAGNAFFDQTPSLGAVCTFDFGDPSGEYNVLAGYNAAHIYKTPGDYKMTLSRIGEPEVVKTIHVLPDKRATMKVGPHESLPDVLRGIQADTVVLLEPGATYDITSPVELNAKNVEFRPAGTGPAPRIRRIAGGKASNNLVVHGIDVVFRGIEFDSDREMKTVGDKKVNIRGLTPDTAHVTVDHCTFRNVDDALFCTPMTHGLLVQDCDFTSEVRSCDVWIDGSDIVVLGAKMATSQHEHNCRSSNPHFYNMLICDSEMHAEHGKETLTFREGQDFYVAHNALYGWMRLGPGPRGDHRLMTPAELKASFVRYAVVEKNAFLGGKSWIQVNEGASDVTIRYNRVDVDAVGVPVKAQGPSLKDIVLQDNYRVLTGGTNEKPFYRGWTTGPNDIAERGSGTKSAEEAERLKGK